MHAHARRLAIALLIGAASGCGRFGAADAPDDTAPSEGGTSDARDATPGADAAAAPDAVLPAGDAGGCAGRADCERRIFVSSAAFAGSDLDGLAGADEACRTLAAAAGSDLASRTWVAWLSDATVAAGARVSHGTRPYRLPNGHVVANDWAELVSASLEQSINVDETGTAVPGASVWTGTYPDGGAAPASCASWTKAGGTGVVGATSYANGGWTNAAADDCATALRIYCIER